MSNAAVIQQDELSGLAPINRTSRAESLPTTGGSARAILATALMATLAAAGVATARPFATPRAISAAPTCSETCAPTRTTMSSPSGRRPTAGAAQAADRRPTQEPSRAVDLGAIAATFTVNSSTQIAATVPSSTHGYYQWSR